ncbi:MAG: Flp pilus assembly complex ATPase component TadA [Planctomycetes bacterium]|nr:Flp pilus assembly complex ATPase component TadA [Planctomycetota bacterium]
MSDEVPSSPDEDLDASPVVHALHRIFDEARRLAATDVYLTPGPEQVAVQYRVEGTLVAGAGVHRLLMHALTGRLKGLAGMDIAERRRPQQGSLTFTGEPTLATTVFTLPTVHGEAFRIAVLPRDPPQGWSADPLFSTFCDPRIDALLREGRGLLLLSGGASDLEAGLAATARLAAPLGLHAHVLSESGAIGGDSFAETTLSPVTGLTLDVALRAAAGHRFELIILPVLRATSDLLAAFAACSGTRLVVAGLHARTCESVPTRLRGMGVPPSVVQERLAGVLHVRSARGLCARCKGRASADVGQARFAAERHALHLATEVWSAAGCSACRGTGFAGRQLLGELLELSEGVRGKLLSGAGEGELRAAGFPGGRGSLVEDLRSRLEAGLLSVPEALEALRR